MLPRSQIRLLGSARSFPGQQIEDSLLLGAQHGVRLIGGAARTMFWFLGGADMAGVWLRSTAKRFMLDLKGKPLNATLGESSSDRVSDSLGR